MTGEQSGSASGRVADLEAQRLAALDAISAHWDQFGGDIPGFPGDNLPHDPENKAAVLDFVDRFFTSLVALDADADPSRVVDAVRDLFYGLNTVNRRYDESLLKTDERELLVPIVIDAAKTCGLDPTRFEYDDPTMDFREF